MVILRSCGLPGKFTGNYLSLSLLFATLCISVMAKGQELFYSDSALIANYQERADKWCLANFDSVLKSSNGIISIAEKKGNKFLQEHLDAIFNICWCSSYHNRLPETHDYLEDGINLLKENPEALTEFDTNGYYQASMIFTYALYFFEQGNYERTVEEMSRIVQLTGRTMTNDRDLLFSTCSYLGQSYFKTGNFDKALQYFEMGIELQRQKGTDVRSNALSLMYKGQYFFATGKTNDAFINFQHSLDLLRKEKLSDVRNSLQSSYLLIAGYYMDMGLYDSTITLTRKSIALYNKDDTELLNSYSFLGRAYYENSMLDSSLAYYYRALKIANQLHNEFYHLKYKPLTGIANIQRDRNNFNVAENYYKEAFKNLNNSADRDKKSIRQVLLTVETMTILVEWAQLYYEWFSAEKKLGLLDTCVAMLDRAMEINDIGRRELFKLDTKETKAALQSRIADLGTEASFKAFEFSHNPEYLWKSFGYIEKSKGNILLDKVDEVRARKFSGIPGYILETEAGIKGELHLLEKQIFNLKETDKGAEGIQTNYNQKFREYIVFTEKLEQQYPQYYRLKYDVSIPAPDLLRKYFSNKSIMIQFHVTEEFIYALALTKKTIAANRIYRNEEFDGNIRMILDQISDPEIDEFVNDPVLFNEFCNAARYLYKVILEPLFSEKSASIKELILIPEGLLCHLPFEILLTKDPAHIREYSELPYLINDFEIRYDYSVSLLVQNSGTKYTNKSFYIGFAPDYKKNNGTRSSLPIQFNTLYANQDEIESCRQIWNGLSYSGTQATELAFREHVSEGKIIHLGTHTYLSDQDSQNSCLAFCANDYKTEDGLVNIFDLYGMNIPAELAILSGCETGVGRNMEGEGIISLARAFKYAGCPNIVMSLWKVNDLATKEIMIGFNKNLKKGMHKDKALQKAKVSYINKFANAHPSYWSSFVLIGNDDPVNRNILLYFIPPVLIIALFIISRIKFLRRLF